LLQQSADHPAIARPTTSSATPSAVRFAFYDDPISLQEASGTQMARVEVATSWDVAKHYDLTVKSNGQLEFVYETPTKVPFQVLTKGLLRGTALVRLHNVNVTLVRCICM
tara:strand:- start:593 stop:922 length:330 start_codon:yes stop_codon:yes gene_type:complete